MFRIFCDPELKMNVLYTAEALLLVIVQTADIRGKEVASRLGTYFRNRGDPDELRRGHCRKVYLRTFLSMSTNHSMKG
jgi:hypothetical protein